MRRTALIFFVYFIIFVVALPITVSADSGPKPSVVIDFSGLSGETYYATLLSSVETHGPYQALSFHSRNNPDFDVEKWYSGREEDYPSFLKLNGFEDADGYYFLKNYSNCSDIHEFTWTYYPPDSFKILLYFPEKDSFIVSGILGRYAFDTYYTATVQSDVNPNITYYDNMVVSKSYDYSWEIISLIARIIITIIVELLIALLLFGIKEKKQLFVILAVNLVTQIALNIALNIVNFHRGYKVFVYYYVLLELAIFIFEAILYTIILRKISEEAVTKSKTIIYALAANSASFLAGLGLAYIIPGIF